MACISPTYINENKVFVSCGKCGYCLRAKRNEWTFRIKQEMNVSSSAWFVTLTYKDETIPLAELVDPDTGEWLGLMPTVRKTDLQKFIKRLRNAQHKVLGKDLAPNQRVRYYAISEYSPYPKYRPHYHGLFFNLDIKVAQNIPKIWRNGHCKVGAIKTGAIHYVTEYHITKDQRDHKEIEELSTGYERPSTYMSLKPAIGANWIWQNEKNVIKDLRQYVINDGFKMPMPKYYRQKIYGSLKNDLDEGLINNARYQRLKEEKRKLIEKIEHEAYQAEKHRTIQYGNDESYINEKRIYHEQNIIKKAGKNGNL